jgi:hypothetical protein
MNKIYLLLGVVMAWLLSVLAAYWLGHSRGIDQQKAVQTKTDLAATQQALNDFVAQTKKLNDIAAQVQDKVTTLQNTTQKTIVEYVKNAKDDPLPADCRIDTVRLQHISAAIDAANAAIASNTSAKVPSN